MTSRTVKFNTGPSSPLWGKSLSVQVSRLVLAAQQETSSWGTTSPGTISINTTRSVLQVAPDSVRFTVDLSNAGFDTQAQWVFPDPSVATAIDPSSNGDKGLWVPPTPGDLAHPAYDARLHDLLFFWDFGDGHIWDKTENVLSAWKDSRYAIGPMVCHAYYSHGTFTASVTVIEPSSGKVLTASTQIIVGNPDNAYPGTQTICINPDGDADFSEAPPGARTIALSEITSVLSTTGDSLPLRWLLKRDATYDWQGLTHFRIWPNRAGLNGAPHFYMGAYGTGTARPKALPGTSETFIRTTSYGLTSTQDIRIFGIEIDGNFNFETDPWGALGDKSAPTPSGVANSFFKTTDESENLHILIADCVIHDFYQDMIRPDNSGRAYYYLHVDNNNYYGFRGQGYAFLCPTKFTPEATIAITGNRMVNRDTTPADWDQSEAIIRQGGSPYSYWAGNDFFQPANTNALLKIDNAVNDGLRIDFSSAAAVDAADNGPWMHGNLINMHWNTLEGQRTPITNGQTGKHGGGVVNFIIDSNIFLLGPTSILAGTFSEQGITIRNNFVWMPDIPWRSANGGGSFQDCFWKFVRFTYEAERTQDYYTFPLDDTGEPYTWITRPFPGMAPIRVYNNTHVFERAPADNDNKTPATISIAAEIIGNKDPLPTNPYKDSYTKFQAVFDENNVWHYPGSGAPVAGLDTTTLLPFRARYKGPVYVDPVTSIVADPTPDPTWRVDNIDIPTYAATTGGPLVGDDVPTVTSHVVPLGTNWNYNDLDTAYEPPTKAKGAWRRDESPT